MTDFTFQKATRRTTKARIALLGGPGCGKTYGALLLARGLAGPEGRVCLIDTERLRSSAYAGDAKVAGDFDVLDLEPPFSAGRFQRALEAAYAAGYDVVVVDSLSHEWAGTGGVLQRVDHLQSKGGNRFAAWREPSKAHETLIDTIVRAPCHVIATMRQKEAHELQKDDAGRLEVVKLGLKAIQRDGVEYEFDAIVTVNRSHVAALEKCNASWSEALTEALAVTPRLTGQLGAMLRGWIERGGFEAGEATRQAPAPARPAAAFQNSGGAVDLKAEGVVVHRLAAADPPPPEGTAARDVATDPLAAAVHALGGTAGLAERLVGAPDEGLVSRDTANALSRLATRRTGSQDRAAALWGAAGLELKKGARPTVAQARRFVTLAMAENGNEGD